MTIKLLRGSCIKGIRSMLSNSLTTTVKLTVAAQPVTVISCCSYSNLRLPGISPLPTQSRKLLAGKLSRKRVVGHRPQDGDYLKATAFACADEFELNGLFDAVTKQGLYRRIELPSDLNTAMYFTANYAVDEEPRDIVVFRDGAVVFWNIPSQEQENFLVFIREFEVEPYERILVVRESDTLDYQYTGDGEAGTTPRTTKLKHGVVTFTDSNQAKLEKFSFSQGLMLSVKLGIWEGWLETYIDGIEPITEDLKEGGRLNLSRKQVIQKTGDLLTLSHLINLSSDLLDTPDFYWDREQLEELYNQCNNYFSIPSRTKVMNNKLSHCIHLVDLLRDHLNTKHEVRLEWMIIILILVEVVFEVVHMTHQTK